VLESDKNNAKARFRLAKALVGTNDLEDAKRELEQVSFVAFHTSLDLAFLQIGSPDEWGDDTLGYGVGGVG
jgi:hypothetical protein